MPSKRQAGPSCHGREQWNIFILKAVEATEGFNLGDQLGY